MNTSEPPIDPQRMMKTVSSYRFIHRYLPVDRYAIRPPASLIVKAVFKTSITPNQLTLASFFFALLASLAYIGGRPALFALGGVLALFSTIFDAADGMLARAKNKTSRYGAFLDLVLDRIADFAVLTGASLGYFSHSRSTRFLVLSLMMIGVYFLQICLLYLNLLYVRSEKHGEAAEAKGLAVFLLFVVSVAGHPEWFLAGLFAMAVSSAIVTLVQFLRKGRAREPAPAR